MYRRRLMIPGPVDVVPEVRGVMADPQEAHYGQEWVEFYRECQDELRRVFRTQGPLYILVGSGSAALDAALGTAAALDGEVLIPSNGVFAERMVEITSTYTQRVRPLPLPWNQPCDLDQVESALQKGTVKAVGAVHCETSTGVLNPVQELGELCARYNVLLVVDAIASLGIERLDMDEWGVGICAAASQKGLEAPPGLSAVAVSPAAWEKVQNLERPGWYLNLKVWKHYEEIWGDWHPQPITHAVSNLRALRLALERVLSEGLEARFLRHRQGAEHLRAGLRGLGFKLFAPDTAAAHGVTTALPPGGEAGALLAYLRSRHGFVLAGGMGQLKGKVIRVGHMGPGADLHLIDELLQALQAAAGELRVP